VEIPSTDRGDDELISLIVEESAEMVSSKL
jgi:hypothetical protein